MGKPSYLRMHKILVSLLLPTATDDDAARLAEEDWKTDVGDGAFMTYDRFFEAMFELSDHWTQSAEAAEYLAFLHALNILLKEKATAAADTATE